jgi:hypothetical protein
MQVTCAQPLSKIPPLIFQFPSVVEHCHYCIFKALLNIYSA